MALYTDVRTIGLLRSLCHEKKVISFAKNKVGSNCNVQYDLLYWNCNFVSYREDKTEQLQNQSHPSLQINAKRLHNCNFSSLHMQKISRYYCATWNKFICSFAFDFRTDADFKEGSSITHFCISPSSIKCSCIVPLSEYLSAQPRYFPLISGQTFFQALSSTRGGHEPS